MIIESAMSIWKTGSCLFSNMSKFKINQKFFWSAFSRIRMNMEKYGEISVFNQNAEKYREEKL